MQQDETRLLQELYEEYLVPLKKVAVKIGIETDDIEDLVQETFIEFYVRYPLNLPPRVKTVMLNRILRSRWIDGKRKLRRREVLRIDDPDDEQPITKALLDNDDLLGLLDQEVQEKELYHAIRECIRKMKQDWRDVIILRIIEGLSTEETCKVLGISDTVCRTRLSRAKKDLRRRLEIMKFFDD